MKELTTLVVPAFLGFSLAMFYNSSLYSDALDGKGISLILLILITGPLALVIASVAASVIEVKKLSSPFYWFISGVEAGILFIGLRVLIQWYATPENAHLEPLFVAIGVGIASIDFTRRYWEQIETENEY